MAQHKEDADKKQYKDNVTVTGESFGGTRFKHKFYYQNGATKDEILNALRAREPGAQKNTVKIWQGPTNEALVAKQKQVDAARLKGPTVVIPPPARGQPKPAPKPEPAPRPEPTPYEPEHRGFFRRHR